MENLQPKAVTGPVTDDERAYAINSLKTTQANLHQSLEGLSAAQLTYKPTPDRWSIDECVEHIALIEKGIFRAIQTSLQLPSEPDKRASIKVSDVDVVKAVRSRAVTLPAPTPFVPTGRFSSTDAALQAFDEQRTAVIAFTQNVQEDLRTHYFQHIALGTLDVFQAILLMAAHSERHRKQIEEVKATAGFPS
jgi:uncharacterized damage-inducible protein DinB